MICALFGRSKHTEACRVLDFQNAHLGNRWDETRDSASNQRRGAGGIACSKPFTSRVFEAEDSILHFDPIPKSGRNESARNQVSHSGGKQSAPRGGVRPSLKESGYMPGFPIQAEECGRDLDSVRGEDGIARSMPGVGTLGRPKRRSSHLHAKTGSS